MGWPVEEDDDDSLLGEPPPTPWWWVVAPDEPPAAPPRDDRDRLNRSSCSFDPTLPLFLLIVTVPPATRRRTGFRSLRRTVYTMFISVTYNSHVPCYSAFERNNMR